MRHARYFGCGMTISLQQIQSAAVRIRHLVRNTPLISDDILSKHVGMSVRLKLESMQHTGSFKIRGASNAVALLTDAEGARGVATHSSGNHALALTTAAKLRSMSCTVVMPKDAPASKRAAVLAAGATIIPCEPTMASREATLAECVARSGATVIPPFDHADVVCGQGTLGLEIVEAWPDVDVIVAPIGGGGMIGGIAVASKGLKPSVAVLAAEPTAVDDAARSKAFGVRQPPTNRPTLADGLRAGIGALTFPLLQDHVDGVVTVSEERIVHWMRFAFEQLKLVVEPSAAVGIAAIASDEFRSLAEKAKWKRVALVICGGNVDLDRLPWIG